MQYYELMKMCASHFFTPFFLFASSVTDCFMLLDSSKCPKMSPICGFSLGSTLETP